MNFMIYISITSEITHLVLLQVWLQLILVFKADLLNNERSYKRVMHEYMTQGRNTSRSSSSKNSSGQWENNAANRRLTPRPDAH